MENSRLEPGLLNVFRFFTGLRLTFAVVFTLTRIASPDTTIRIFELIEPALLIFILSLPALRDKHEHWLLAIALLVAGIGPLLTQAEVLSDNNDSKLPVESILALQTWGSMIVLLLPVVIIAWQYRFRQVVWFSLGITLLNVLIVSLMISHESFESVLVTGSMIFRLITFMMIGWLVGRVMRGQREQRQALEAANRQLTHHAATLEQLATTRERNRLARELHDTLAHTLSAVAVQLEAINALWDTKPEQVHERLQKTIEVTRSGLTETRRVLQDLRASPLEDLGLALAIRHLAESTASRSGLKLNVHIAHRLGIVTPDIEQTVYRIAQEALANVATHANAKNLTVRLGQFNSQLILTVADDGQGFDLTTHKTTKRFGIQGMRERAEMVGGILELETTPGQGTTVRLSIEVGI
ncbi:MAG: sensor histidine kinase [Anaerolineae bacterium]|nr:sensor histidine kinase [Anaerolineae bacterium]